MLDEVYKAFAKNKHAGGDLSQLLTTTLNQHQAAIELRRPEEILNIDGISS